MFPSSTIGLSTVTPKRKVRMDDSERKVHRITQHMELLRQFHMGALEMTTPEDRFRLFLQVFSQAVGSSFAMMSMYSSGYGASRTLAVEGTPLIMEMLGKHGLDFRQKGEEALYWPVNTDLLERLSQEKDLSFSVMEAVRQFGLPQEIETGLEPLDGAGRVCMLGIFGQNDIMGEVIFYFSNDTPDPDATSMELFRSQLSMLMAQERARRRLAGEERRWRFALESAGDGVWDINRLTGEMFFSPRWSRMLGYEPREIEDPKSFFTESLHPDDRDRVMRRVNDFLQGEIDGLLLEFRMLHRQGHYIWILSRGRMMEWEGSGEPTRLMGTHTDITRPKQMEQELRTHNDRIKKLNRQLEKSVNLKEVRIQMLEELKQEQEKVRHAQWQKELLFASLSHDLRNPLNALTGLIDLLLMDEENSGKQDHLMLMKQSARSMVTLLNGLLDFTRLESGHFRLENEPFSCVQEIQRVASLYRIQAEGKGLDFSMNMDEAFSGRVVGDALRLEQIVSNLLANAVKFTRTGNVALEVHSEEEKGQPLQLTLRVTDTGIGISEDELPFVFDCYRQASGIQREGAGGTGLGLYISRQLAEKMGGTLTAESELGKGSVFTLQLPLKKEGQINRTQTTGSTHST